LEHKQVNKKCGAGTGRKCERGEKENLLPYGNFR
jgi:hypothetical protein